MMVKSAEVTRVWQVSQVYAVCNGCEPPRSTGKTPWHELHLICEPSTFVQSGAAGLNVPGKVAP
jgi:hypothetical protein